MGTLRLGEWSAGPHQYPAPLQPTNPFLRLAINKTEDTDLFDGVYVASENEGAKHLYFVPVGSVIDLCRRVASADTGELQYQRGTDGVMRIVGVKAIEEEYDDSIQMLNPETTTPCT